MTSFEASGNYYGQGRPVETTRITSYEKVTKVSSSGDEQLFTDPELLRSIGLSYRDIKGSVGSGGSRPVSQHNTNRQYAIDNPTSTSFVMDTKPAQELYVDNTSVPPPTHFYYINPQQPADSSRMQHVNQHRTYVVSSAEKPAPQHIVVQQPVPIIHPTVIVSPPVVRQQQQYTPSVLDRSVHRSQSMTRLSTEDMVPRAELERCQSQCRMWEQKYNDLYRKYTAQASGTGGGVSEGELNRLRQENIELEQRLSVYQSTEQQMQQSVERQLGELINKYRNETLKECELLYDRFRL